MKKRRKNKPETISMKSIRSNGRSSYKVIPKAFNPEHADLYGTTIDATYRISVDQLRTLFGLGSEWRLTGVTDAGYLGQSMRGLRGASVMFSREAGGPSRAMEILAGEKQQEAAN